MNSGSTTQRRHSSHRHQRQAELSLRIEEGRSIRPSILREDDISTSFVQDFFSKPQSINVTSLSHADAGPSPLEVHPGQRVAGLSKSPPPSDRDEESEFQNGFPEPSAEQQRAIEQRGAIFGRTDTNINAEEAQIRITSLVSNARKEHNLFTRLFRLKAESSMKPSLARGLEYAGGFASAHATAMLSQKPSSMLRRRNMYVLEYDIGETNDFVLGGSDREQMPVESSSVLHR